jgi:hypothetical protein
MVWSLNPYDQCTTVLQSIQERLTLAELIFIARLQRKYVGACSCILFPIPASSLRPYINTYAPNMCIRWQGMDVVSVAITVVLL